VKAANTSRGDHHIDEIYQRCHLDHTADFVPGYREQPLVTKESVFNVLFNTQWTDDNVTMIHNLLIAGQKYQSHITMVVLITQQQYTNNQLSTLKQHADEMDGWHYNKIN